MSEIKKLLDKIVKCNKEYRLGEPSISDYEYDKLVDRLKELDPQNPWFAKGVNDEVPKKRKYTLTHPMFSLNKCKSLDEISEWLKQEVGENWKEEKLVITPKFDGLSVQKELYSGNSWTRGNGEVGQVCTPQMKKIPQKILCLDFGKSTFVRGEVMFTNEMWKKVQEKYQEYKSPRNTATGWINGDYKKEIPYGMLSYMCYEIYSNMDKNVQLTILNEVVNLIECPFEVKNFQDINEKYLEELFMKWSKDFPIDGLVIDINSADLRQKKEANGNPSYARAYKHPSFSEKKQSKIVKVRRNINRFGIVTPILEIEPVELAGATVKRANGINMSYVYDWGLIPGTVITVIRSGEVIPKVVEVEGVEIPFRENFNSEKEYKECYERQLKIRGSQINPDDFGNFADIANLCPCCGKPLNWDKNGINLVCINSDCEEKKIQWIVDFFKILKVENVKEDTFRSLYESGLNTWQKLLEVSKEDLVNLDGWAEVSASQYRYEMDRLTNEGVPFARLCHASGYFGGLGEKTIQLILDNIGTVQRQGDISKEDLVGIKGISEISASQYLSGSMILQKKNYFYPIKIAYVETPEQKKGKMTGEVVVFSGFRDSDLKKRFEAIGAVVEDGLTKRTTVLIVKDKGQTTSKTEKAMKMGIPIYSQKEIETEYANIFE